MVFLKLKKKFNQIFSNVTRVYFNLKIVQKDKQSKLFVKVENSTQL